MIDTFAKNGRRFIGPDRGTKDDGRVAYSITGAGAVECDAGRRSQKNSTRNGESDKEKPPLSPPQSLFPLIGQIHNSILCNLPHGTYNRYSMESSGWLK